MKKERKFEVFNQYTLLISPKELAEAVKEACQAFNIPVAVTHIKNPRVEKEDHHMIMENKGFLTRLLRKTPETLDDCIRRTIKKLLPYKNTIIQHYQAILPSG